MRQPRNNRKILNWITVPRTFVHDGSHGQKSRNVLHFWGFFQFTQAQLLPSPHKQIGSMFPEFFSEFQLCIGWGEGELQENFKKGYSILILDNCPKDFCPWL